MVRFTRLKMNREDDDFECNEIGERVDANREIVTKAKENCVGDKEMKVLQTTAMASLVTNHVLGDNGALKDMITWVK